MNSNTDDRDPDLSSVGSSEDLEEALKWLEELTARQGKPAELANPIPPASLDSPFRGLIDDEEGDLPDWLREAPQTPEADSLTEGEPESRLDWLAKMAQRESIEELPTLEWRRLSEPAQAAMLPEGREELLTDALAPVDMEAVEESSPIEAYTEFVAPVAAEEIVAPDAIEQWPDVLEQEAVDDTSLPAVAADIPTAQTDEPALEPMEDLTQALTIESHEELPSMDDLDAAMAWIEELAASQDAPIEDVPSVADRALASKLMMEAGLSADRSALDELGSDSSLIESLTPTHPFIEEEDFADTVVLVETMAADQGGVTDIADDDEAAVALSPSFDEAAYEPERNEAELLLGETTTLDAPPEERSFKDAMAFLDEMAGVNEMEPEEVALETIIEEPADEAALVVTAVDIGEDEAVDSLTPSPIDTERESSDEEAPWYGDAAVDLEQAVEENADEPFEREEAVTEDAAIALAADEPLLHPNGRGHADLEEALLTLDALALPAGKTLDEIDADLRLAQITPARDVSSALDWLEMALMRDSEEPGLPSEMDEAGLIATMPEDPDAVLAWLEQIAAQDDGPAAALSIPSEASAVLAADELPAQPLVEDLGEADLFNMPDDPDEAMAWLEGLARGQGTAAAPPQPVDEQPLAEDAPPLDGPSLDEQSFDEPSPAVVSDGSLIPTTDEVIDQPPATPAREKKVSSRRRKQPATHQDEIQPPEPAAPPPAEEKPTDEKSATTWVDLLKPLD